MKSGLPAKYAKMGFKKGWREYKKTSTYKRSKGIRVSGSTKRAAPARKAATTGKTVVRYRNGPAAKHSAPRVGRPKVNYLTKKTMDAVLGAFNTGATALISTFAVQKIPKVKELSSYWKAGIQGGTGFLLLPWIKNRHVLYTAGGLMTGAVISLLIPLMPEGFRFGKARRFNSGELAHLQQGKPYKIVNQSARPTTSTMGIPVKVGKTVGNSAYSRGKRAYAAY